MGRTEVHPGGRAGFLSHGRSSEASPGQVRREGFPRLVSESPGAKEAQDGELTRKNPQPRRRRGAAPGPPQFRTLPHILGNVSETRDKRRRNDLDLFVLALVSEGISTPYSLKSAAGLSPGATIPALTRLIKARFVLQGKPGPRGRTDHKITPEGRRYLKSGWKDLIEEGPSGDLDADLRVALLALWVDGDRKLAADFLRQSAGKKLDAIATAGDPDAPDSPPPLALWYRRLRSTSANALIKGESAAALAMAKALPRRPSGKQKQGRVTPKSQNRSQSVPKGS